MKTYIGIKSVEAVPMTRGGGISLLARTLMMLVTLCDTRTAMNLGAPVMYLKKHIQKKGSINS